MTRRLGVDRPSWRDDRVWQAGFLIGSAVAASAVVVGRRAEKSARRGLVDWPDGRAHRDRPRLARRRAP